MRARVGGNTTTYLYGYDSLGRMISGERLDNGTSILRTRQAYDEVNRPVYQAWQVGGTLYEEGYTYNSTEDGSLNTHTTATGQTLTMQYDGLRRLSGITGGIYGKSYTYRDISDTQTTTQIASVVYDLPVDRSYGYTYDNMGNIATYTDANGTVTYTYDAQGQLLSATDGTTSYTYTYDTVGNILTANGHTYSYTNADWKDLLTAYDGEAITYDAIGNPLSYYNGTRWTFTWEDGRQLATATDGTTNVSYTYDSDGIRTSKTVDGVKHTYVYASGKLLRETYGDTTLDFFYSTSGQSYALNYNGTTYYYITNLQGDVMQIVNNDGEVVAEYEYDPYASGKLLRETFGDTTIDFFYSTSGQPYALSYNGTTYYYITNLQGDVMQIVNSDGAVVAEYEYDPYGNILSTTGTLADTLGEINPLRYRGYVYDQESNLYYLQSRYYDAKVGRFLNADSYASTGQGILGYNMFAYCNNNPLNAVDPTGHTARIADRCLFVYYESEEEAAIAAGTMTRLATNRTDNEYACGVYELKHGGYAIGKMYQGEHDSVNLSVIVQEDLNYANSTLVAFVHSHPYCNGHVPNEFSKIDSNGNPYGDLACVIYFWKPIYLAAPNGELKVLRPLRYIVDSGELWTEEYTVYYGLPTDDTKSICISKEEIIK